MVSATCPSPNDPLWNGSVPRYFRGTFHSILFQNFPVQPLPRQTIPTIFPSPRIFLIVQWYTNAKGHWCRPCSHHPRFFYFFNPDYVRQPKGILDSNQGEYVCHHLRATSPRASLDKKPSGTPRASLSSWTSSYFFSLLKRVPPLNCHVEISNGLSVPLSWNSWSRTSRNLSWGAHPLTKRSAPFWALHFSSRITLNV
jgi:hypothetical protein